MKDTLELLKEHLKYVCWMGHDEEQEQVLRAAIKEIKELRKSQAAAEDGLTTAYMLARKDADDEVERLREENEKLRAALRTFIKQWNACGSNNDFGRYFANVRKQAVAALGEEK